jgi:hypothetical protein
LEVCLTCEELVGGFLQEMMRLDYCFVPVELYFTKTMS